MVNWKVKARRTGRPARFEVRVNSVLPEASLSTRSGLSAGPPAVIAASIGNSVQDEENPTMLADWIGLIRQVCAQGSNSTLELARLMNRARRALPYGGWGQLWRAGSLPFSRRKGEMLVVIGECVEGLDAQNSAQLPMAWNTLYYLARLGRAIMERLIEQGRIHPGLSLHEAQTLLAQHHPARCKSARSKLRNRLANLAAFIRLNAGSWPQAEQDFASRQLSDLAGEIREAASRADICGGAQAVHSFHLQPSVKLADQPDAIGKTP